MNGWGDKVGFDSLIPCEPLKRGQLISPRPTPVTHTQRLDHHHSNSAIHTPLTLANQIHNPQYTIHNPKNPTQIAVMATSSAAALFSAPSFSTQNHHHRTNFLSFQGLRPHTNQTATASTAVARRTAMHRGGGGGVRAQLSPPLVISLSTGLSLFLGRFVFFNFQRENAAKQGLPEQNGLTHFEAGDSRAKEYVSLLKSNDPVGFNIVDVLAWGSIGHVVAYYILATSSNGYDPKFFG